MDLLLNLGSIGHKNGFLQPHRSQERILQQHPLPSDHAMPKTFTYEELKEAANNFSEDKVLGRDGFGIVHKGVLRDGRIVAIKQQIAEQAIGEKGI
ncbi:hypothetical protein Patl1_34289 [Pistacia atlantica]|uniref:Uncharacterized protein n=1 Tax=Pistacia atlantica TaxID=434234 RepID=A0ACC0ZWJ1_9ROSI|nr:hypothetical protein Patl1_34289 [Pistacia atlantica]